MYGHDDEEEEIQYIFSSKIYYSVVAVCFSFQFLRSQLLILGPIVYHMSILWCDFVSLFLFLRLSAAKFRWYMYVVLKFCCPFNFVYGTFDHFCSNIFLFVAC